MYSCDIIEETKGNLFRLNSYETFYCQLLARRVITLSSQWQSSVKQVPYTKHHVNWRLCINCLLCHITAISSPTENHRGNKSKHASNFSNVSYCMSWVPDKIKAFLTYLKRTYITAFTQFPADTVILLNTTRLWCSTLPAVI